MTDRLTEMWRELAKKVAERMEGNMRAVKLKNVTCNGCRQEIKPLGIRSVTFEMGEDVTSKTWCAECGQTTEEEIANRWDPK